TAKKVFCDPAGIRTQDPYIKSVLLYQLSYRIGTFVFRVLQSRCVTVFVGAKVQRHFQPDNPTSKKTYPFADASYSSLLYHAAFLAASQHLAAVGGAGAAAAAGGLPYHLAAGSAGAGIALLLPRAARPAECGGAGGRGAAAAAAAHGPGHLASL
nr:hypothetical protein [Tanacetum cinerariifolium]